jgi:hypothetical protein
MNDKSNVFSLKTRSTRASSRAKGSFKTLREEFGLTVIQAAKAMKTSPSNIEIWEAHDNGPTNDFIREQFFEYSRTVTLRRDSNLLFGRYPLRMARDVLGMSLEMLSGSHGYSASAWQKFESNQRVLGKHILAELEEKIQTHFADTCSAHNST